MTRIQKVAELAGVSTATVSRALAGKSTVSDSTRARVVAAAKELGYVVSASASSLASGRTRNVGVVVPFLDRWFYSAVLKGAHGGLTDAGYDVTLYHLDTTEVDPGTGTEGTNPRRRRLFEEFLLRKRVDALIAVTLELSDEELAELHAVGKPLVGLGGPLAGVPTLSIDDVEVSRLATEHLISLGHREIAHIGGDPVLDRDFHLGWRRRKGFEQALESAGIALEPRLLNSADFTVAGGYRSAKELLGDPRTRPTAIFAGSDEMAMGAIMAARDLGLRVPDDVSVIGIDGHDLADFYELTTVDQFAEEQGRLAAQTLLRELSPDGEHPAPQNVALPFKLIVRGSTAAPPDRR